MSLLLLLHVTALCTTDSIVSPGDYRIIGTFPVNHKNQPNPNSVLLSEYFKYVIKKINLEEYAGLDFFGYEMYDTFSAEPSDVLTSIAVDILLGNSKLYDSKQADNETCTCLPRNPTLYETIGIVGTYTSPNAVHLKPLISSESIPLVSYGATSTDLNLTENFYRTIPSDENQALFIKDLLLKYNWTYVVTLGSDDVYGKSGIDNLEEVLERNGICVHLKLTFHHTNRTEMKNIFTKLVNQDHSRVVVIWGLRKSVEALLREAAEYEIPDFIWIVYESTVRTRLFKNSRNRLPGTFLAIEPDGGQDQDFQEYFLDLKQTDVNGDKDIWLKKLFQSQSIKANETLAMIRDVFNFPFIGPIYDAILVFVRALELYHQEVSSCNPKIDPSCFHRPKIYDHAEFNRQFISSVNFKRLDGGTFRFTDSGETNVAKYNLYMSREKTSTTAEVNFQLFTSWERELNTTAKFLVHNDTLSDLLHNISSKCSDECNPGFYPVFDGISKCCWVCIPCKENHVKNISGLSSCLECPIDTLSDLNKTHCLTLTPDHLVWTEWRVVLMFSLALLGCTLVIFTGITFQCFSNTPIVRSSNIGLSYVQLTAHFLIFLTPPLFVGMDSTHTCKARLYSSGVLLSVVISISFIKVTHLLTVFNIKIKLTAKEIIQQKTKELGLFILLISIHASIVVGLDQSYPIVAILRKKVVHLKRYKECTHLHEHYTIQLAYLLFLQILCGIQAFRGRNLPGRFNEAKYTSFAVFISAILAIIGVPLVHSMARHKEENFVVAMITMVINLSLFAILYGYKVKLILFYPEENTTEIFRRDRLKKILNSPEARRWRDPAVNINKKLKSVPNINMSRSTETILTECNDLPEPFKEERLSREITSDNNEERRSIPIFTIYYKNG